MAVLPTGAPLGPQTPQPQPLPPPPGIVGAPPMTADPRLDPKRAALMKLLGGGA